MVPGKVKAAMGLQKSPSTPKLETSRRPSSSPSSAKAPVSNGKVAVVSRSVGAYFPRSSAQVQPRPSDVAEIVRLAEELQEKESRLRTKLPEQKMLKETVAVVPSIEKEVTAKMEAENRALRFEVEALRGKIREMEQVERLREEKMSEMVAEIEELRRTVSEQQSELRQFTCGAGEIDECSSSQRFQGLVDASAKSFLLKNIQKSPKSTNIMSNYEAIKPDSKDTKWEERELERIHQPPTEGEEISKHRLPRIPKPPPLPSSSSHPGSSSPDTDSTAKRNPTSRRAALPPIPPPPDFPAAGNERRAPPRPPAPPPPPTPGRNARLGTASVRRVPEVVEFYHSLMRRDSKRDSGAGVADPATAVNARNMIGEIENRSSHLLAIKTEVETQGDFIRFLIKEVENAAYSSIDDLVAFVKWLDDELSFLVDERAVLKHFDWPEAKADAMREAAFGYCDLRKLESEATSFRDDKRLSCSSSLKKILSLLEKLEHGVYNLSRLREGATERYKNFQIPCDWMLDTGLISQIKLASVKLAIKYMKRVTSEIEAIAGGPEEEDLMLQGVRFAFRVHQFAGGFDVETMRAFQELKDKARKFQAHKTQVATTAAAT